MGNIQKLNISLLKDQKNKFNNEKDSFYHSSYQIFNSSYLKNCSDFYVVSMKNNLEQLYSRIQNGYTNISKWLNEYCETYESLEDVLSQNRSAGSIINNNIRNYVSSKLSLLEDFDLHKGITRISVETSSSIGFNASTVIDEFADLYSDFQTKKEGITSKVNSGIEILQEKTGAVIHSAQSSITNGITDAANALDTKRKDLMDWWSNQAKPWIDSTANKIGETVKRTDATVTTFRVSLVEGVMHFGEAIVDLGAIVNSLSNTSGAMIADGVQSIYGKVTGNEWTSVTETMWDKTKTFVAEEHVTGWFDNLYQDTSYGQYLQENSYGFETTRSIGDGIGYIAGVTCLSIATFGVGGAAVAGTSTASSAAVTGGIAVTSSQTALIAGLAGVGKGTEKAWNDGASTTQGLAYGALNGVWEGTQYYLGSKIGAADGFGSKIASKILGTSSSNVTKQLVTSASRIMLDGIDGGVEGFVQPLLSMTYKEGSYKELFNENGGWSYVATNAVTGAGFSLLGELGDISKFINDNKKTTINDIDVNIENELKSMDDISNKIDVPSQNAEATVKKDISEIEEKKFKEQNSKIVDLEKTITDELIPISILEGILSKKDSYEKFINFDANKDFFGNHSKYEYEIALQNLIRINKENNYHFQFDKAVEDHIIGISDLNINFNEKFSNLMEKSTQNQQNLISGIVEKIPEDLDDISKARAIYLKLNQNVTYSDQYYALNKLEKTSKDATLFEKKADIYNKKFDIENMDSNKLVCNNWSNIYKELLEKSGFDSSKINVIGKDAIGCHKYVTVELNNNKILLADATNNIDSMTDLAASKYGLTTHGFIIADKYEYENLVSNNRSIEVFRKLGDAKNKNIIEKIDENIGYFDKEYINDFNEVVNYYSNKKSVEIPLDQKVKTFIELFDDKSIGSIESYPIMRKMASKILGDGTEIEVKPFKNNVVVSIALEQNNGYLVKVNDENIKFTADLDSFMKGILMKDE